MNNQKTSKAIFPSSVSAIRGMFPSPSGVAVSFPPTKNTFTISSPLTPTSAHALLRQRIKPKICDQADIS